jgi:hypothetical protein
MKRILLRIILMMALYAAFSSPTVVAQTTSEAPLTNASVVRLVRAGFKEKTVIAIIRSRPNRFDLDPDRLIDLKRNGVTEKIILTMLQLDALSAVSDDDWSDESFIRGNEIPRAKDPANSRAGETDIFGSNGGSNSQTRSRGLNGSSQGETTTTGSATVRIIRTPAEAGGASLKLEKTPTLNNDSIIRLVEAGFSEGTIIKRIEDSPVDFDLSPEKLNDLRKRRVTDAIIAAMTLAMDESVPKAAAPGRSGEN